MTELKTDTYITLPPYSPHAEESLIGSVLINPGCFKEIDITAPDFYGRRNQLIWQSFVDLQDDGKSIDITLLQIDLDSKGKLGDAGGPAYITGILAQTGSSLYAQSFADVIREKSKRRRMIEIASQMASEAYSDKAIDDTIGRVLDDLVTITQHKHGAEHISKIMGATYDEITDLASNPRDLIGVSTGLIDLDKATSGLCKKSLYLLSGEMGTGKSLLAYQICSHMAKQGHPGVVYELEMPARQIAYRHLSANSKIETEIMKRGKIEDWEAITLAIESISNLPIYISDATDWTTTSLRADAARLKASHKIEWIMVDYLMLLQDMAGERDEERTGYISRALKAIAKDLDVIVIVINSMNKAGIDSSMPTNTSQRGSAQVGYDADDVWFLMKHKPEFGKPDDNMRTLIPTKARERDHMRVIHLLKLPGLPAFGNITDRR